MRKIFTNLIILVLCLPAPKLSLAQDSLNILFVGNSFTYFWNVPAVVSAMASSQGLHWICSQSTAGGANWEQHWKGEKELQTREKIIQGDWDYVVLQNQSLSALDRQRKFEFFGTKLIELVKSIGAKPILYTTWSYHSDPSMQDEITSGYSKLAQKNSIRAAPVGPIWSVVRAQHPSLDLYHDDKHQSPLGTYLIGLTFFREISGRPVKDIPRKLSTLDARGDVLHLMFTREKESELIKDVIDGFSFE